MQDIPYTVRWSAKAKRLNLWVDPLQGLVVVLPSGVDAKQVPRILKEKQAWIEKHRPNIARAERRRAAGQKIPARVDLPALDERLAVHVAQNGDSVPTLRSIRSDTLEIRANGWIEPKVAGSLLRQWLKKRAKQTLPGWLAHLAAEYGLTYNRVGIRCQKTRWGSCSSRKTISLNCKLLFLKPSLVEHVLTHELCHTLEPNHSRAFWRLFQRLQPDALTRRRDLKELGQEAVPAWAEIW